MNMTDYEFANKMLFYRLCNNLTRQDIAIKYHMTMDRVHRIEMAYTSIGANENELLLKREVESQDWETIAKAKDKKREETLEIMKMRRKRRGITGKDIGEKLGISFATIYDYENGKVLPKQAMVEQFCSFYGVDAEDFRGANVLTRNWK